VPLRATRSGRRYDQLLRVIAYLRLTCGFEIVERDIDRFIKHGVGMGQGPMIFHCTNSNILSSQERQVLTIVPVVAGCSRASQRAGRSVMDTRAARFLFLAGTSEDVLALRIFLAAGVRLDDLRITESKTPQAITSKLLLLVPLKHRS
jgi:hypothetical protein